jgi:hypothetical protein
MGMTVAFWFVSPALSHNPRLVNPLNGRTRTWLQCDDCPICDSAPVASPKSAVRSWLALASTLKLGRGDGRPCSLPVREARARRRLRRCGCGLRVRRQLWRDSHGGWQQRGREVR